MIEDALATQLAGLLVPFLPKLLETTAAAGKKAVDTLAGKAGESAWNKAVSVWNMLRPEVEKEPEVAKALQEASKKPNDPRVEAMLSLELEKLTLPPETIATIQKLIAENKSNIQIVSASDHSVSAGGNMIGNTIITGSQNTDKKA
jgi:hypothetical protein